MATEQNPLPYTPLFVLPASTSPPSPLTVTHMCSSSPFPLAAPKTHPATPSLELLPPLLPPSVASELLALRSEVTLLRLDNIKLTDENRKLENLLANLRGDFLVGDDEDMDFAVSPIGGEQGVEGWGEAGWEDFWGDSAVKNTNRIL